MVVEYRDPTPITAEDKANIANIAIGLRTKMKGKDVRELMASGLEKVGSAQASYTSTPKGIASDINSLKEQFPNGNTGMYVTANDGHWYVYDYEKNRWADGGVWQAPINQFDGLFSNGAQPASPKTDVFSEQKNGRTWIHVSAREDGIGNGANFSFSTKNIESLKDNKIQITFDIVSKTDQTLFVGCNYRDSNWGQLGNTTFKNLNLVAGELNHINLISQLSPDLLDKTSTLEFYITSNIKVMGDWMATDLDAKLYGETVGNYQLGWNMIDPNRSEVISDTKRMILSNKEMFNKKWIVATGENEIQYKGFHWNLNKKDYPTMFSYPLDFQGIFMSDIDQRLQVNIYYYDSSYKQIKTQAVTPLDFKAGKIDKKKVKIKLLQELADKTVMIQIHIVSNYAASTGNLMVTDYSLIPDFSTPDEAAVTPESNSQNGLPEVHLKGDISGMSGTVKKVLEFELQQSGKTVKGFAETKWQGNSSQSWDKKAYRIKTYQDKDLTEKLKFKPKSNWLADNKWNLKAYFTDATQTRDVVGANLGAEIWATQKKTPLELIKASNFGFVDGFPVNLYINDQYAGLYSFNIPKGDYGETKAQIEGSVYSDVSQFRNYPEGGAKIDGTDFELNDPDELTPEIKESFNEMLRFAVNSTDEDFVKHIDEHLDLESAIDYLIFSNIIINTDAWGKNQQLITYDLKKWYFHPYDLDSSLGGEWDGSLQSKGAVISGGHHFFERIRDLFPEQIKARYAELRTWLTPPHMLSLYRAKMDAIGEGNYQNEFAKWDEPNKDSYTWQQLTDYIIDRFHKCDKEWLQ